jgi:hypothetical protein
MILGVHVLSVPASGEGKFQAEAVGTVGIKVCFVGHVMTIHCALGLLAIVEAVEAKSPLLEVNLGGLAEGSPDRLLGVGLGNIKSANRVVSSQAVTSNHSETLWERRDWHIWLARVPVQLVIPGAHR